MLDKVNQLNRVNQFVGEIIYDTKSWEIENFKKAQNEGWLHFKNLINHYNTKIDTSIIENIFLGLPTIELFALEDSGKRDITISDAFNGINRLQAILMFINNQIPLNNFSILTEMNGLYFEDLYPRLQRTITRESIRFVVFKKTDFLLENFDKIISNMLIQNK